MICFLLLLFLFCLFVCFCFVLFYSNVFIIISLNSFCVALVFFLYVVFKLMSL